MIRVISPGLFTTVQDLGRHGYAHLGVSPAGAADPLSFRIGIRLVGNHDNAPALEVTLQGGRYEFECDATVAITGAAFDKAPMWHAVNVAKGTIVDIGAAVTGARGYLCVRGGIDAARIMGSASTHILSGFGSVLKRGDTLRIGNETEGPALTRVVLPPEQRKRLRLTSAAQTHEFDARQAVALVTSSYQVTDDSNRMGLRLKSGVPLHPPHEGQMLSEGVALGALQVPPSGEPIILFVDSQTTGGYPVIASVITADLASVGQLRPRDRITFEFVSFGEARRLLLEQEAFIHAIR